MRIEDFEPLDLSIFIECADIAVNCRTEEEALHFLAAVKTQFPHKCESWNWPNTNFSSYREETSYCVGINPKDLYNRMMYGTVRSFSETDSYTVIPFTDLLLK